MGVMTGFSYSLRNNINKVILLYDGKVGRFKCSDAVGTSIHHGSAENMVLNTTIDVLSAITRGGLYF